MQFLQSLYNKHFLQKKKTWQQEKLHLLFNMNIKKFKGKKNELCFQTINRIQNKSVCLYACTVYIY